MSLKTPASRSVNRSKWLLDTDARASASIASLPPMRQATPTLKRMGAVSEASLDAKLASLVAGSSVTMRALSVARSLKLDSWCIGAGAVRNLVWDHLHGFEVATKPEDIDLVFHDATDLSQDLERLLENKLALAAPEFTWEVVNQAAVHRWLTIQAEQRVEPFRSLAEGVASWPEVATCVGISLTALEQIEVVAPHGLTDLFEMVVRWNPTRISKEVFQQRVAKKRFSERWPRVQVLAC